jgi:very-short-patch-repair endonuclease
VEDSTALAWEQPHRDARAPRPYAFSPAEREQALQAANCFVLRISARRLLDEPEVVLVEVATALARRRAA